LGITQIPNIAYATTIGTAFQAAIAHHGTMPNNRDPVPTLVNICPQQLIAATANIPPTIDAPAFAIQWGNYFEFLN